MSNLFLFLYYYKSLFLLIAEIFLIIIVGSIIYGLFNKYRLLKEEEDENDNIVAMADKYRGRVAEVERQNLIRQFLTVDGVDPNPNSYLGISDGGREIFTRCLTISKLPRRVKYADTLKDLFNFPNKSHTVFIEPVSNESISRMLDKQINVLESEKISAYGNPNRLRKLSSQSAKTSQWALQVEEGEKKFFYAYFLFVLHANSIDELNNLTDSFRSIAKKKNIEISNCYGVQSEAFLAGFPFNKRGSSSFAKINTDALMPILIDQEAASVILNYTTDYFSHKEGVPLGRNMFNRMPFVWDNFHKAYNGYTSIICGKTGTGKSATLKMYIERAVPQGHKFVIVDSQTRKGTSEGEFSSVTAINGGVNYQISSRKDNILNIFDVQESVEFKRESEDSGFEVRTLDLNGAITDMVYNIRSMMQIGASEEELKLDVVLTSDIDEIIRRAVKELFAERGIVHGDANSLYENSDNEEGYISSGTVPKKLPVISDFFKKILIYRRDNVNIELDGAYRLIVNSICEYVRELYYSEETVKFFTKEEYLSLPYDTLTVDGSYGNKMRYIERNGKKEYVKELHGVRPYYDGQSTFQINRDCPVTNIDISQLPENERKVAREIAIRFVNEQFIKKNSERLGSADKLCAIFDEAHENFQYSYGRKTLENIVRTARKRHVAIFIATQTVVELSRYPETADILKQAAVKMICKQDASDKEALIKLLNITETQAEIIVNGLGSVTDKDDPEEANKHRGEMCVVDGEQVAFIKVDYLRHVESLAVETDASSVIKVIQKDI